MRALYEEYTSRVESFGLDECWLDLSSPDVTFADGIRIAEEIRLRVREAIRLTAIIGVTYTVLAWGVVFFFPEAFIGVFTGDPQLIVIGPQSLRLYFFGFFFMAFQFAGQTAFTSLGFARQAIFFSLLRKAFIVVPLTLLLPRMGLGVSGVYLAEPVSNALGGLACFVTMYFTLYKKLGQKN